MVHQTELTYWFLRNADRFKIRIEHLGWIESLIPSMTDVCVRLEFDGCEWSGWGYGESEDEALTKALAEAIERIVMQEYRFQTSNGLAAHMTFEDAAESALGELRERDLVLCHFYTRTPFVRAEITSESGLVGIEKWFKNHGIQFFLYHLGSRGFVSLLDGRHAPVPFGFIIGAAIKKDPRRSALSAAIEAARRGYWILMNNKCIRATSLDEFWKIERPNFSDHGRLALDLEYAENISYLFDSNFGMISPDNDDLRFEIREVQLRAPEFKDCPLRFAKASSPDMQDLFLGELTVKNANFKRLNQFAGRKLSLKEIDFIPHPID